MGAALNLQLSLLEARILGVLVEKELTVSDIYPLSLNALTAGCNQKNNRNPVLNTSELDVQAAIDRLKPLSLVIESSGSRVMRYSQNIGRVLKVPSEAVALLAALGCEAHRPPPNCARRLNDCIGSPTSARSKASSRSSPNARSSRVDHWCDCYRAPSAHASHAGSIC